MTLNDNKLVPRHLGMAAWCFFITMASVTLTTPLWGYYEQRYGFGSTGVSIAFGAMAVGVFIALPIFGGLSDYLGRFRVMTVSLVIDVAAMVIFLVPGITPLLIARVLQGCAVALTVSSAPPAINAALSNGEQSHPALAASISTVANLGGLGFGSLLSALVVLLFGHPFTAPYVILIVLLGITVICCARIGLGESSQQRFMLRLPKVPDGGLRPYLGAGICALAAFAAFSVYASLGPGILAASFGVKSSFAGPGLYCMVMVCSAIGQLLLMRSRLGSRRWLAIVLFITGFIVISVSTAVGNLLLFVVGGLILGLGSGVVFAESSRVVTANSHTGSAAASQSGFFMMAYIGMIAPIVGLASLFSIVGTSLAFVLTGGFLSLLVVIGTVASASK